MKNKTEGERFNALLLFTILLTGLINVSCKRELYTLPVEPAAESRRVFINSKPANAAIYLNGRNTGYITPDTLNWLPVTKSSITLKLPLYSDTTFAVDVAVDETKSLFIDFTANTKNIGRIFCNSDPQGADIYINNSLTGSKTPYTISRLIPGNYNIKIASPLHRPDSTSVTVSASNTSEVFLALEDTSKWVSYTSRNSPVTSDHILSIAADQANTVWAGTDNGLMSLRGNKITSYTPGNTIMKSGYINCIAVDNLNRKWIGTSLGLFVFDDKNWTDYSANLPDVSVTSVIFDKAGTAWIGTLGGLVRFSNGSWTTFNTSNSGLKEKAVTCLLLDNLNRLWIGSVHNYISIYDGVRWSYFDDTNISAKIKGTGTDAYQIQSMVIDNSGKIWVCFLHATGGGPIIVIQVYNGSIFADPLYVLHNIISMYAKENYLLFGTDTWGGIYVLNTNSGILNIYQTANTALKLFKNQVVAMDNKNNIWVGTYFGGLAKFKSGNF